MDLTDTKVRNAKPQEKDYRLIDGHGLHLFVKTNGAKLWRWRYAFEGKGKLMSFGAYPAVTLTAARKAHEDARKVLAESVDPMVEKKDRTEQESTQAHAATTALHPFRDLAPCCSSPRHALPHSPQPLRLSITHRALELPLNSGL